MIKYVRIKKRVKPIIILYHIKPGIWWGAINEDSRYPGAIGKGIILNIMTINVGESDWKNKIKKLLIELNAH